jgi:hypothetical protein
MYLGDRVVVSTNLIKVVAAFVSGLVVALGSALIYVHVADQHHPVPVSPANVGSPTRTQDLPDPSPEPALSDAASSPAPTTPSVEARSAAGPLRAANRSGTQRHHAIAAPAKPDRKPVQIAQVEHPPVYVPPLDSLHLPPPEQAPADKADPSDQEPQSSIDSPSSEAPVPAPGPATQPHVVTLAAGTTVSVRLGETLSTDHNYTGDTFRATLMSPIILGGFIIADRGSKVLGRVVNSQSGGRVAGFSDLTLVLTEINTTDGQRVQIETTTFQRRGASNAGPDAAKIAGAAALGALIGGIAGGGKGAAIGAGAGGAAGTGAVLLSHGRPAVVESETQLLFRLANPVMITEKLN